jgi:hypothetical protein
MASTIKVNNIQNQCGANIANKCGTTITLGASGDTITLACGASQTGFGRTGTVDWDTTAKTASFTAVSGNGYFVNTTSGAVTMTLPASPSAGDIVSIKDYAGTFSTNACTVARNGSNIRGAASDFTFEKNNSGGVFIYVDATEGWQIFVDGSDIDAAQTYICATGGTITECGDYKIHTFTGPGTFTVNSLAESPANNSLDYLVIAGGGGGGTSGSCASSHGGSGGGAGGYRFSDGTASGCYTTAPAPLAPLGASALIVCAQSYPITVGGGGNGSPAPSTSSGSQGSNSVFSTITSTGGGGGGSRTPTGGSNGGPGGSGGGANTLSTPGSGNTPPVSPPQGNNGGVGGNTGSPGGGGIGSVGGNTPNNACGGDGGAGIASFITGSPVGRGGGGSGSGIPTVGTATDGGGTAAPDGPGANGGSGTTNTGGGGGGGARYPNSSSGGAGGSGIVIIRYKYQ